MNFQHHRLAREFWENGRAAACPVYDMHGHMGAHNAIGFPITEAPGMVRQLERINGKLVFSHHWSLFSPEYDNATVYETVRRFPERLRMYVGFIPHYQERMKRDLDAFDRWKPYAVGFKILADYHGVPVDSPLFAPVLERADADKLPVLFHTWNGSVCDGPEVMRRIVARYTGIRFIIGHSFNSNWDAAIQLVRDYPDRVYLELTSIPGSAGVVEKLAAGAGSKRILFGTDLPWFDEYQAVGGILGSRLDEEQIHDILHRNAEALLPGF